jgi:hypothetical protein
MLIRDLLRLVPATDSKRFEEDYISYDKALNLAMDASSSVVFPDDRLTDWIKVYVKATFAVFPSHTSCHDKVLFSNSRAYPCLPNFDWHVARLL